MADSIIGFRARFSVNDGAANAEQFFDKTVKLNLPAQEVDEYEEKTLYTAHRNRIYRPTLRNNGMVSGESYFNKADYLRLKALLGVEGKVWKIYTPDEDGSTVTLVPLVATLDGFLKKLAEVNFEKDVEVRVPFEFRVNSIVTADGTNDAGAP